MGINTWTLGGLIAAGIIGYIIYDRIRQEQAVKAIATKAKVKADNFALRHSLKDTSSDWTHTPHKEFLGMQNENLSLVNTFGNSISVYDDVW